MPHEYWLLLAIYSTVYGSLHPFYINLPKLFELRFSFDNEDAGHIASVPYIIAAITIPFMGYMMKRLSNSHHYFLFCGVVLNFINHLAYKYNQID